MIEAIVITGAPGAGKTSVWDALTGLLDGDEVPFAAFETEQFALGHPWLPEEQAYAVMAAACRVLRGFGRRLFVVTATTETGEHIDALLAALAADRHVVVCLRAAPETVAVRVLAREPPEWLGRAALAAHARELALQIPALDGVDLVLDNERGRPHEVAHELRARVAALGFAV